MAKQATLTMLGTTYNVRLVTHKYQSNGGMAVEAVIAETGEPFCSLSTNLPETEFLEPNEWFGKHWSENEGFLDQLVAQGVIKQTSYPPQSSGFVQGIRAYKLV